jgi:hypothetical protein
MRLLAIASLLAFVLAACEKKEPTPSAAPTPTEGKVTGLDKALENANQGTATPTPAPTPPPTPTPVTPETAGTPGTALPPGVGAAIASVAGDWADMMKPMLTDLLMSSFVKSLEKGMNPAKIQVAHAKDFVAGKFDELNKIAAEYGFADFATWSAVFTRVVQASGRMVVEKLGQKATDMLNEADYGIVLKYWDQIKDGFGKVQK